MTDINVVYRFDLPLSERPSDSLTPYVAHGLVISGLYALVEIDRANRRIRLLEPNGSIYVDVPCPAVAAGYRPEDLG